MTKKEAQSLQVGDKVYDRWYKIYGQGTVVEAKKTVFVIKFDSLEKDDGMVRYDLAHMKFVEIGEVDG